LHHICQLDIQERRLKDKFGYFSHPDPAPKCLFFSILCASLLQFTPNNHKLI